MSCGGVSVLDVATGMSALPNSAASNAMSSSELKLSLIIIGLVGCAKRSARSDDPSAVPTERVVGGSSITAFRTSSIENL